MVAQRRDARVGNASGVLSGSGVAGGVAAGRSAPPAAAPMRDQQFEAAKAAAEQRAATSLASEANASVPAGVQRVGARTFVRRDGGWVDTRYTGEASGIRLVRIKAFSKAYFDLMEQLPELRAVFAMDDQIIVSGKSIAIAVGADGASELDPGEMRRVVQAW